MNTVPSLPLVPPSPGRARAAARAVRREAEAMALFPELRRFTTPEQRLSQVDEARAAAVAADDAFSVRTWRDALASYRRLTGERRKLVQGQWRRGCLPRTAYYFADLVHQVEAGRLSTDGYRSIPVNEAHALRSRERIQYRAADLPGITDEPFIAP
jgi:hypothetical protein